MANKQIIYKGMGFYIGLPARDMTLREWRDYPEELRNAAIKAGIYEVLEKGEGAKDGINRA